MTNIRILTYNILFKELHDIYRNKNSKENIINYILNKNYDIVVLQEVDWFNLFPFDKLNKKYYIEFDSPLNEPQYSTFIFIKRSKFIINKIIKGINLEKIWYNLRHRGILGLKIIHKKTKENIIVIGGHLEHMDNFKVGSIDQGNNTVKKTINLFNKIIDNLDYENNDNILILLDSNEFYTNLIGRENIKLDKYRPQSAEIKLNNNINITFKDDGYPTCCILNFNKRKYNKFKSDVIGTNFNNKLRVHTDNSIGPFNNKLTNKSTIKTRSKNSYNKYRPKIEDNTYSDHQPVIGYYNISNKFSNTNISSTNSLSLKIKNNTL
jgi:hypothetical protein